MITKKFLLPGLAVLLLVQTGCIFSPDPDPNPIIDPPVVLPFPGTKDQVMENFRIIYENMDIAGFRTLLHPDYLCFLQQSTIDAFPSVGETLDITEELQIHERMFSGQSGTDAQEELTNPISSIGFAEPEQITNWARSPADDRIPNADFARFNVFFEFHQTGSKILQVQGEIIFYLTSRDSLHEGITKPYYQMIGQVDLTEDE